MGLRSMLFMVSFIWLSGCANPTQYCPEVPAADNLVSPDKLIFDFKTLASAEMQGRKTNTSGSFRAQRFIHERFSAIGLKSFGSSYKQPFLFGASKTPGINLIGWLEGQKYPDQYLVVTAHYDHLGTRGKKIFYGADDNASGVAGLLALAQQVATHGSNYSIIFVATDAEEQGLYGAKAFTMSPPVNLDNIRFNLNLDMISRGGRTQRLYVAGTRSYPEFKSVIQQVQSEQQVCLKRGHDSRTRFVGASPDNVDWRRASDHAAFVDEGIPYLYFGVDIHAHYHKPSDRFESVDLEFYAASVSTIWSTLQKVDQMNLERVFN